MPRETSLLDLLRSDGGLEAAAAKIERAPAEVVALSSAHLLTPIAVPPPIRDFASFERHVSNASRAAGGDGAVSPVWYEHPVFYFSNPAAVKGPNDAVFICDWTARDLMADERQFVYGPSKSNDGATSLGPFLVTPYNFSPRSVQAMTGVWDTATPEQWQAARFTAVDGALQRVGMSLTVGQIAEARSLIDPVVASAGYAGKALRCNRTSCAADRVRKSSLRVELTDKADSSGSQRSWRSLSAVAWSAGSITTRCCCSSSAAASLT